MCERESFLAIRGGRVAWLIDSDRHDAIVETEGLEDNELCDRRFVRIECKPKADPFSTNPDDWEVQEDEPGGSLPAWYEREEWAPLILDELTLRRIPEERRTGIVGKLVIPAGQLYRLPWLRTAADIYVHENAKLDAPALTTAADIYVLENAKLDAPALATAADIDVHKKGELNAPLLKR
jgi:hypothetical protein